MKKPEYRAVIKFSILEGLSATEIDTNMVSMFNDYGPSFQTEHRWVLEFKRCRTSFGDEPGSGQPKATTPEIIHNIFSDDPSLT